MASFVYEGHEYQRDVPGFLDFLISSLSSKLPLLNNPHESRNMALTGVAAMGLHIEQIEQYRNKLDGISEIDCSPAVRKMRLIADRCITEADNADRNMALQKVKNDIAEGNRKINWWKDWRFLSPTIISTLNLIVLAWSLFAVRNNAKNQDPYGSELKYDLYSLQATLNRIEERTERQISIPAPPDSTRNEKDSLRP